MVLLQKIHSILLSIYYNDYNNTYEEKGKVDEKHNPKNLLIKGQGFIENEERSKPQPEETIVKKLKSEKV